MARPTDSNEQLLCSFCGKSQRQVKKLMERIKSSGRLDDLKEDVAQRQAIDLLVESATPVAGEPDGTSKES